MNQPATPSAPFEAHGTVISRNRRNVLEACPELYNESQAECYALVKRTADALNAQSTQAAQIEGLKSALTQADDTLGWAQHYLSHANTRAIPDTRAIIASALSNLPAPVAAHTWFDERAAGYATPGKSAPVAAPVSNDMREALTEVLKWTKEDLVLVGDSGNITIEDETVKARIAYLTKLLT